MEIKSSAHRVRSKVTALLLLLLAGCQPNTPKIGIPIVPRQLYLSYEMAFTFREIQREYEVETVRCLSGYVSDGGIHVTGLVLPRIVAQGQNNVTFIPCEGPTIVGYYHNHPQVGNQTFCNITSTADVETLNRSASFLVAVITCDDSRLVYRFKYDVIQYETFWRNEPITDG